MFHWENRVFRCHKPGIQAFFYINPEKFLKRDLFLAKSSKDLKKKRLIICLEPKKGIKSRRNEGK